MAGGIPVAASAVDGVDLGQPDPLASAATMPKLSIDFIARSLEISLLCLRAVS